MFCFLYIRYLGVPYEFCAADHEIDIEFSYNIHFIKLPFLDNPSHCWSTCILSTEYAVLCSPGMPGQCDVFEVLRKNFQCCHTFHIAQRLVWHVLNSVLAD